MTERTKIEKYTEAGTETRTKAEIVIGTEPEPGQKLRQGLRLKNWN